VNWHSGFFVQSNNALVLCGKSPVNAFLEAFNGYWENDDVAGLGSIYSCYSMQCFSGKLRDLW
jgi:hypothetical protein